MAGWGVWLTFGTACADNCGLLNYQLSGLWLVNFPTWMPRDPIMQGGMIYGAVLTISLALLLTGWFALRRAR